MCVVLRLGVLLPMAMGWWRMNVETVKGLMLSLVDQRCAEHGTAELDMEAAIELCRIALRFCWLKDNYDLAAKDVDSIPLEDALIDAAMADCRLPEPESDPARNSGNGSW